MLKYAASNQAASALYLVNKIFDMTNAWTSELEMQSDYDSSELKVCAKDLWALLERANEFQEKHQKQVTEVDQNESMQFKMLQEWCDEERNKSEALPQESREEFLNDLAIKMNAKRQEIEKNSKEYRKAITSNNKNLVAVIKKFSLPDFQEAAKILFHVHCK